MKKNFFNTPEINRREFLHKAALILASAGLAPLAQKFAFQRLASLIVPLATAQSAGGPQVDFFLNLAVRQSYSFSNLFPCPAFARPDAGGSRGCIWRTPYREVNPGNGRSLFFSEAAYANGGVSLENFAKYIAMFECMRDDFFVFPGGRPGSGHSGMWASQIGGFYVNPFQSGGLPDADASACLTTLFASEVTGIRERSFVARPKIPGTLTRSIRFPGGDILQNPKSRPPLTVMNTPDLLMSVTPEVPGRLTRTEASLLVTALKKINTIQEAETVRYRLSNASNARLAAEQGVDLVGSDAAISFSEVYTPSIRSKFGVGGLHFGQDFGQALMMAFLGFRTNIVASAYVNVEVNHAHHILDFNNPDADAVGRYDLAGLRDHDKYFSVRLGALLDELVNTDHPFRPGKKMIDHTLIKVSSEGMRGLSYLDGGASGWQDGERAGGVLIGGAVEPGYYGDAFYTTSGGPAFQTTSGRGIFSFDPVSGNTSPSAPRIDPSSLYKTVAEMMGIPTPVIQAEMGTRYGVPTLSCLKKRS